MGATIQGNALNLRAFLLLRNPAQEDKNTRPPFWGQGKPATAPPPFHPVPGRILASAWLLPELLPDEPGPLGGAPRQSKQQICTAGTLSDSLSPMTAHFWQHSPGEPHRKAHAPLGKRPAARTASQRALFVTIATSSSSFCDPRQPHRNPVLLASVSVHPTSPAFRRLVRAPFKDPSMMPKPRLQSLGDTQAPASGMLRRELRNYTLNVGSPHGLRVGCSDHP